MCSFMMSLTFFLYSKQHSVHSENRHHAENRSSGRLQEVKNNWKIIKLAGPKKWSRSLTGGGLFLEIPTVRL